MSLVGIVTLLTLALLLSKNRKKINKRTIALAFAIQASIAALIFFVPYGAEALNILVAGVQGIINFGNAGTEWILGGWIDGIGFSFAVRVLPIIVFFSALMSTLYYLGIMQKVIAVFGGWLHKALQTSQTESMSAVANVFIGHTEAPLVVRPYLAKMTNSELFAVMTGGCATIAGAVMAGYAQMGVDLNFLLTASFMAAPGGLLMAKIIMPETDYREIQIDKVRGSDTAEAVNIFEAIGNGAADGLKLALNVGAMLLAFVAMIALINGILAFAICPTALNSNLYCGQAITLQEILGYVLAPLAFLLGIPWNEAFTVGSLIGTKFVANEFVAYADFIQIKESLSSHSQAIVTFALCGFANLSSIAILLGGLGTIVPERRHDIARMGLLAVLGGTLSNLMSATLAGLFLSF